MTEKVRTISNPLTIIAIFAALAEINATISIGLIDDELHHIFIWFLIGFPTTLVLLFFFTLIYHTEVMYSPSDYQDDKNFHVSLFGEPEFKNIDKDTNTELIKKNKEELGVNNQDKPVDYSLSLPDDVSKIFSVRYLVEKELRRLSLRFIENGEAMSMTELVKKLVISNKIKSFQGEAIKNIYSISNQIIHPQDKNLLKVEKDYVLEVAPVIIEVLKKVK